MPTAALRRARAARDEADARPAGELAVGVGHVGGAASWRQVTKRIGRVVQGVEHGEVALAGHAEASVDAVDDELVDEDLSAGAAHVRRSGCSRKTVGLCSFGLILVGRIDVADRPLPRPLGGQDQHANERRRPDAVTPLPGRRPARTRTMRHPVRRTPFGPRLQLEAAVEEVADSRSRMCVGIGDPARREVDPVAPHDPAGERVELDSPRDERFLGFFLGVVDLPDERVRRDRGGPVMRHVVRDVVDDALAADRRHTGRELVEGKPHEADSNGGRCRSVPAARGHARDGRDRGLHDLRANRTARPCTFRCRSRERTAVRRS